MSKSDRSWWHRYAPRNVSNPFGLIARLVKSGSPAARSALLMAATGVLMTPIDVLLSRRERRLYENPRDPDKTILIIAGPPRSGTTLVAQYLMNALDACYINNLTSLFPRSPITINKMLQRWVPLSAGGYDAFYGKSTGLAGANDALYIWDRWLGNNRAIVPNELVRSSGESMRSFFRALTDLYGLPVVNKVNRLNTCAHLVASELEKARFVCLHRKPEFQAQSLYAARCEITGNMNTAYGVQHAAAVVDDPVEDVCRQVMFHESHARKQQQLLGPDVFSIVSYEEFCKRPAALARSLATEHPDLKIRDNSQFESVTFEASEKIKLSDDIFNRMRRRLEELGAGQLSFLNF